MEEHPSNQGLSFIRGNVGCIIVTIVISLFLFLVYSTVTSILPNIVNPPRGTVTTSATILTNIKPLGQLVSVEVEVAKANILVDLREGLVDICRYSTKHVSQASIRAGIDLTKMTETAISFDNTTNTYLITLPSAQLTSCSLDPVNTEQYWSVGQTPLCNVNWDEVRRLASYVALNEFRDDAIGDGILLRAESEAETVITNFVKALTNSNVEVVFTEDELMIPKTCNPDQPGQWTYDEEQEVWVK